MAQWVGYMVSIKCEDDAAYQGEILSATSSEITLIKAFCNGIPCSDNEVKIRADEIEELKLIEKQTTSPQQRSTITIAKPIPKRANRSYSTSEGNTSKLNGSHSSSSNNHNNNQRQSKPIDIDSAGNHGKSSNPHELANSYKSGTPNNKRCQKKWSKGWKDEECFGSPLDHKINKEFDFEKNLALFDKQALWDELNSQKPDVIKHIDKKSAKYRHDENVIATVPTTYRQIMVPKQDFCEYVTDDGLIIPSISRVLRRKLWEEAEKAGLVWEKQIELIGRAATEISIQLLGGAHRLSPRNSHQWPTVVVLCGPHKQGAIGLNAARQIASHGINTIAYAISTDAPSVRRELVLYGLTKNRIVCSVGELPSYADLIIVALCEDTDTPRLYMDLAEWANKNRAPVLALDPPSVGTPGFAPKFSLLPVLPLPHSSKNGKLYLVNLGFPVEIFNNVGIKYKPPFGPKFVIPLHPRDD